MTDTQNHNSRRNKAFTMIELLVTIAIILILAGIVLLGVHKIGGTTKSSAAKVDVQNLQGMLAELETSGSLSSTLWATVSTDTVEAPADVTEDTYGGSKSASSGDPVLDRWQSNAVRQTQRVIGKLRGNPKNRSIIQSLPGEKLMKGQANGEDYGNGSISTTGGSAHGTPNPPLLVDPWQNPIIFVPGGGLVVAKVHKASQVYKKGSLVQTGSSPNFTVYRALEAGKLSAPPGTAWEQLPAGAKVVVTAPGNRPFFASAGPDGDFQSADDNVYSFE